jgi:hypothetical protein
VHGATVVPDHEVADGPLVLVAVLLLHGVVAQLEKQQAAVRYGPVDDLRRVRGDVKGLAAGAGDGVDEGMHGAFEAS